MSRWKYTLIASWLAQICSIMGFAMCVPFLAPFVRELGIREESRVLIWSGWLATAAGLVMALIAPVWGILADKHGRKLMVMRSMFGGMIVLGLMAHVTSVHQLLVLRMMQGLLTGTVAASIALVSSVVPTRRAGFALGLMATAMYIGNSLGPGVGGQVAFSYGQWVSEEYGLRMTFTFAAGMLLVAGLLTTFGVREEFDPGEVEVNGATSVGTIWQVLALPGFATMAGLMFLVMFAGSFVGPMMPLYIEKVAGDIPGAATKITGYILAGGGIAAAISATVLGRVGDRWGYGKVVTLCTLLTGLTLIPHAFVHGLYDLLFWRLLASFAGAGTIPAANALIRHIVPRHACGKAFGLMQSIQCLGWAFGPLVGGWLAAHLGMFQPFLIVGVMFVLISFIVMRIMPGLMQRIQATSQTAPPATQVECEEGAVEA